MNSHISQSDLQQFLKDTLEDNKLSQEERDELKKIIELIPQEKINYLRNKSFDLIKERIRLNPENTTALLNWLERVIKILMGTRSDLVVTSEAHFSPGESCRKAIIDFCYSTKKTLDICVFTISDDRLTKAIVDAHERGIKVRIITDNDKSEDMGSDVDYLIRKGIELKMDETSYHMHHKFAISDENKLLNGSFNWTRSATKYNEENISITNDQKLLAAYIKEFDSLWDKF